MEPWTKDNNRKVFFSPLIIYHCVLWQNLVIARLFIFCWILLRNCKHSLYTAIIFTIPFGACGAEITHLSVKYKKTGHSMWFHLRHFQNIGSHKWHKHSCLLSLSHSQHAVVKKFFGVRASLCLLDLTLGSGPGHWREFYREWEWGFYRFTWAIGAAW